jgi:hypothetical protein
MNEDVPGGRPLTEEKVSISCLYGYKTISVGEMANFIGQGLSLPQEEIMRVIQSMIDSGSTSKEEKGFDTNDGFNFDSFVAKFDGAEFVNQKEMINTLVPYMKRIFALINIDSKLVFINRSTNPFSSSRISSFKDVIKIYCKETTSFFDLCDLLKLCRIHLTYKKLVMKPHDIPCSIDEFNIFPSFKAAYKGNLEISHGYDAVNCIMNFILYILAGGKRKNQIYIVSWLHHLVRFPSRKAETILIFHNKEKEVLNFFLYFSRYILGPLISSVICTREQIEENVANRKLFIFLEELDVVPIDELLVNNGVPLKKNGIELEDRIWTKFVVFTSSGKLEVKSEDVNSYAMFSCKQVKESTRKYIDVLEKMKEKEVADTLLTYLWNTCDDVDLKLVPKTTMKIRVTSAQTSDPISFLEDFEWGTRKDVLTSVFYKEFKKWSKEKKGIEKPIGAKKFHDIILENKSLRDRILDGGHYYVNPNL